MADPIKLSSNAKLHRLNIVIDALWVLIAFLSTYATSSYFNFSDHYYLWARQYEKNIDIDELLPALLVSLMALLWFAKQRMNESKLFINNNHALLHRILEVQEDERKKIARDLHDDLGQYLSAIKAQANCLLLDTSGSESIKKTAKNIVSSADYAYHATRDLISALRPVALDELGLSDALEHLLDSWRAVNKNDGQRVCGLNKANKPIDYHMQIEGNINNYSESLNISIFRIVQEALTNIAKHAHAKSVQIGIKGNPNYLSLAIMDDGVGFDTSKQNFGYGLLGIAERVESINGKLKITSNYDATHGNTGTKINIQINP